MPEVAGISLANARLMLRNAGFDPERVAVRYQEAYRPADEVTGQVPAPGTLVAVDEPVELVVSRRSLLHALPQVFQKADRDGGHFLREFLWIFDHLSADLQRKLDRVHLYFDPREAPPEFLDWLASWVALTLDQAWPEERKRKLIRKAIEIYEWRGTVRGLKLFLSIFTGVEPRVFENRFPYKGFRIGQVRIGLDSIVLPQVNLSHCFIVEVPARYTDITNENILKVHDIIRMEKPVHSMYVLTFAAAPKSDQLQAFVIGMGRVGGTGVIAGERSGPPQISE
ncbi:phage tail protein [Myxococcota bacterium]|jgi:phage tail-like protein|nr:phage tail protein [Myxococcota bacterium]